MTSYKLQQVVPIDTGNDVDHLDLEIRLRYWERALVGQLARQVHEAGEQFTQWPTLTRDEATVGGSVVVIAECTGQPRPPWHDWRSNEDTSVAAYGIRDNCLSCNVHRMRDEAKQPCTGPRS